MHKVKFFLDPDEHGRKTLIYISYISNCDFSTGAVRALTISFRYARMIKLTDRNAG